MAPRVAIIGSGITGMAAAFRLKELLPNLHVDLFDSNPRPGGVLATSRIDQFLVEHSADMFTTKEPEAESLCQRLSLENELVNTNQNYQRAFICKNGSLAPVPSGLQLMSPTNLEAIESTTLLTPAGKKRFLDEANIPPANLDDESLFDFATRRFGTEAYENIIQPLVGGIYTADPKQLSLRATLPQYLKMEREHGSIIKAVEARNRARPDLNFAGSGARYSIFKTLKGGLGVLVDALSKQLTNAGVNWFGAVAAISRTKDSWKLKVQQESRQATHQTYDSVLLACPAKDSARLLAESAHDLSQLLAEFKFASSAIVIHGIDRQRVEHLLNGFGFVVPLVEGRKILAGSFSSVKFPDRCRDDHVLIRSFVGGACQPELLLESDEQILSWVRQELNEILGCQFPASLEKVVRWNDCMPQYHLGHLDRVAEIESIVNRIPGLYVAGKSYHGVGIPACIRSAETAAEKIASSFSG